MDIKKTIKKTYFGPLEDFTINVVAHLCSIHRSTNSEIGEMLEEEGEALMP